MQLPFAIGCRQKFAENSAESGTRQVQEEPEGTARRSTELPLDVMFIVAKQLPMRACLLLMSCSTGLLHLLQDEGMTIAPWIESALYEVICTGSLWNDINFLLEFGELACAMLTDDLLKSFLMRVNAKRHSATIALRGCSLVCGLGLAPLRGSKVLELLDLRNTNARLDMAAVDSLLGSFLPVFRTLVMNEQRGFLCDGLEFLDQCNACREVWYTRDGKLLHEMMLSCCNCSGIFFLYSL